MGSCPPCAPGARGRTKRAAHSEPEIDNVRDVRDGALESALQEAQECEQVLQSQVPVYFLSGDEKSVAEQADKETITAVYRIIDTARVSEHRHLKNALAWERRYKALEQALEDLGRSFSSRSRDNQQCS
jgi:hypothetical protein